MPSRSHSRLPPIGCSSTRPSPSRDATAIVDYLARARHLALLRVQLLQGGARQHAWLRRRRSDAAQSGDRRRGAATAPGSRRCARAAWGTSSISCRTTWASPGRRTRGGRTCSRTAPARATRTVFDIDWHPLKPELENKVLLPVLGDAYGAVLERQEITLEYDDGAFRVALLRSRCSRSRRAPTTASSALGAGRLLERDRRRQRRRHRVPQHPHRHPAPARAATAQEPELRAERDREKEVIKRRLAALTAASPRVLAHIERAVDRAQRRGRGRRAASTRSTRCCPRRPYRLAYWRVAGEEINYRRFFDINELAAIRDGGPGRVRARACLRLRAARGAAASTASASITSTACSIPAITCSGCRRARASCARICTRTTRPLYVVVEKILGLDEDAAGLAGRRHHRLRLPGDASTGCSSTRATSAR